MGSHSRVPSGSHRRSTQTSKRCATRLPCDIPSSRESDTSSPKTVSSREPSASRDGRGPERSQASSPAGSAIPLSSIPHPCSAATAAIASVMRTRRKGAAKDRSFPRYESRPSPATRAAWATSSSVIAMTSRQSKYAV